MINKSHVRFSKGVAVVEFALVSIFFFTLVLGVIEWGRVLFNWNAAVEATHMGARTAVVCGTGSPAIFSNMQSVMPSLENGQVVVSCLPSATNCERVVVSIQGYSIAPLIPFFDMTLTMPPFSTTMVRESLSCP